jgi:hypothetical protein
MTFWRVELVIKETPLVKDAFKSEFKLNDLEKPCPLLGIQFDFLKDKSVSLRQQQYIQKVLSDI